MTNTGDAVRVRREYSGAAVLGVIALGAGILLYGFPIIAILLGSLSVVLGLRSRAQLKADADLRGVAASVLAFFGGLLLVVFHAAPFVIGLGLASIGPLV
jgi:hypothetical protein